MEVRGVWFLQLSEALHYWCAEDPTLSLRFSVCHVTSCLRVHACVCVLACRTSLLWSHKSRRSATCQHLHITGSSVSDNAVSVALTTWEGRTHTRTSLPICGRRWLCVWRVLCYTEDSPGSLILSKFPLAAWLWFGLSVCIMKVQVSRSSSLCDTECVRVRVGMMNLWHWGMALLLMNSLDSLLSRQNTSPLDANTAVHDQYIHVTLYIY